MYSNLYAYNWSVQMSALFFYSKPLQNREKDSQLRRVFELVLKSEKKTSKNIFL